MLDATDTLVNNIFHDTKICVMVQIEMKLSWELLCAIKS